MSVLSDCMPLEAESTAHKVLNHDHVFRKNG